jgi:hypothetical protein
MINNTTCTSSTYKGNTLGNEILPGIKSFLNFFHCNYIYIYIYIYIILTF